MAHTGDGGVVNPRVFHNGKVQLYAGNCIEILRELTDNSIDAVVTDPPYHLTANKKGGSGVASVTLNNPYGRSRIGTGNGAGGFMGKAWDGGDIAFRPELWAEVLRVLKPGGHMVCFGGTRTYHRMTCAIEDAGFEIRDAIMWHYGSGFPKSHDVSKGIDRAAGVEREVVGSERNFGITRLGDGKTAYGDYAGEWNLTAPATDAARQWQGYGTALKPSTEIICLARKPLSESTVAANVLRWGTGALNIDGCRIKAEAADQAMLDAMVKRITGCAPNAGAFQKSKAIIPNAAQGRWPANLCHDGSPEVLAGFPETADSKAGWRNNNNQGHEGWGNGTIRSGPLYSGHSDSGSAARFFYTSKADADDRLNSKHPTVKPVDLMQWLVRLVCPNGATVLDPFAGTGTTGAASFIEGRRCVLIEREAEYLADIERRMELLLSGPDERSWKLAKPESLEALPLFALTKPAA